MLTVAEIIAKNKDDADCIHIVLDGKEEPKNTTDPMYEELYNGFLSNVPVEFYGLEVYDIGEILDSSNQNRCGAYSFDVSLFEANEITGIRRLGKRGL